MEWLGQAVVAHSAELRQNRCINSRKTEEIHFFEPSQTRCVLCICRRQSAKSKGDSAIAVEPVVIVESSMGGLPAEFSNRKPFSL